MGKYSMELYIPQVDAFCVSLNAILDGSLMGKSPNELFDIFSAVV